MGFTINKAETRIEQNVVPFYAWGIPFRCKPLVFGTSSKEISRRYLHDESLVLHPVIGTSCL